MDLQGGLQGSPTESSMEEYERALCVLVIQRMQPEIEGLELSVERETKVSVLEARR